MVTYCPSWGHVSQARDEPSWRRCSPTKPPGES